MKQAYAGYALARRDHSGILSGCYRSYDEALHDIPPSRIAGWDNDGSSSLWVDHVDPVLPSTYPLFFWLEKLLTPGSTLVDLGGSIGLTYYGYRRYSTLPDTARWIVVEVPKIAEQGALVAIREQARGLEFSSELASQPACDLLLAAGAIQYMKESIPGLLETLGHRPRHILLNKLPLTPGRECWSLQNFGPAVSPYHIYNETAFLAYFARAGYEVADRWAVPDLSCDIPFYPQARVPSFTGLYLRLRGEAIASTIA